MSILSLSAKLHKMPVEWKKLKDPKLDHLLVLEKLVPHIHHATQGTAFSFPADQYMSLLTLLISFPAEIPRSSYFALIQDAVGEAARHGGITDNSLIKEVQNKVEIFLRRPQTQFSLITPVSIMYWGSWFDEFARIRIVNGSRISLTNSVPAHLDWDLVRDEINRFSIDAEPSDYTFIIANVMSRTHKEAVELALDQIDLLRGIWNLLLNEGRREMVIGGNHSGSQNQIVRGSYSKLYEKLGRRLNPTGGVWTNDSYHKPRKNAVDLRNSHKYLLRNEASIRKALGNNPFRKRIESWIREYGRSLDLQDNHLAYLVLWRILEQMSGVGQKESHVEVIRRISFLFSEVEYARLVLRLLKDIRNEAVHVGTEMIEPKANVDELRSLVETTLKFYIFNKFKLLNNDEVVSFFDLSPDPNDLKRKQALLKKGLKFRSTPPYKSRKTTSIR